MLTFEPATAWGLHERGLLREGLAADVCVFDPDRVGARHARGVPRPARGRPASAAEGHRLSRPS